MSKLHLLHIGKTGGSALKHALRTGAKNKAIMLHKHDVHLRDIPEGEKIAFSIRDPVSRFVSAFNSRLRKGQPLHNNEWTEGEAEAFSHFSTPNELAEGLSSPSERVKQNARFAMANIYHVSHHLTDWLESVETLRDRKQDIGFIFLQQKLDHDFLIFTERYGLSGQVSLPNDPVASHRMPGGLDVDLSATGAANIADWYARDIALFHYCLELRDQILQQGRLSKYG